MITGIIIAVIVTIVTFVVLDLIKYNEHKQSSGSLFFALDGLFTAGGFILIECVLFGIFTLCAIFVIATGLDKGILIGYGCTRLVAVILQALRYLFN